MTDIVKLSAWFIVTMAAGWSILTIVLYKKPILFLSEKLALSYCVGLGFLTLEMALLSVFNIPFSVGAIVSIWIPFFILAVVIGFMTRGMDLSHRKGLNGVRERFSLVEKIFVFGIIFEICYTFFRALVKPLEAYDAIAIYAIKAKAFYIASSIPRDFLKVFGDPVVHPEYPLLVPLAESSMYIFLAGLNDLLVKIIFPLYYVAILVILYFLVRRIVRRNIALLAAFLLATIPHFNEYATIGYADLVLAVYYSASFFYLLAWIRERKTAFLILSFLLSVLGIWTKAEGVILIFVNMIIAFIYVVRSRKADLRRGIIYIAANAVAISAFLYIKRLLGLEMHVNMANINWHEWFGTMMNIKRVPLILYEFQIQFFGPKKWNIIWMIFIAALILNLRAAFMNRLRPVTLAILLALGAYALLCLLMPKDAAWLISKTANRFFLQFVPVVVLWIAILFKEKNIEI